MYMVTVSQMITAPACAVIRGTWQLWPVARWKMCGRMFPITTPWSRPWFFCNADPAKLEIRSETVPEAIALYSSAVSLLKRGLAQESGVDASVLLRYCEAYGDRIADLRAVAAGSPSGRSAPMRYDAKTGAGPSSAAGEDARARQAVGAKEVADLAPAVHRANAAHARQLADGRAGARQPRSPPSAMVRRERARRVSGCPKVPVGVAPRPQSWPTAACS